jgi:hypothetical protein
MVPTPVVRHKKGMRLITAPTAPPVRIVSRLYSWTRTATCSTLLKTCWPTLERLQQLAQLSIVLDGSQSSICDSRHACLVVTLPTTLEAAGVHIHDEKEGQEQHSTDFRNTGSIGVGGRLPLPHTDRCSAGAGRVHLVVMLRKR